MSKKSFEDYQLSNEIKRALAVLKYETPTEVQNEVIPLALENQDLVVKSQTGSGKTALLVYLSAKWLNGKKKTHRH